MSALAIEDSNARFEAAVHGLREVAEEMRKPGALDGLTLRELAGIVHFAEEAIGHAIQLGGPGTLEYALTVSSGRRRRSHKAAP